ncbi:Gfo/Idh/MocA family oxidoreductase [Brachybacterium halotolerans subsp. kimchii]|uniref:Gfo/Idh/MocA family protein n=1 Tax=Brachybacterium halotolerans TaxID=2795215 RepID=UPI001E3B51C8|nr:Gfo/Idh/MocA family oxidoreductase [Brachybacterium halotolerans]UEJ84044.1 Gfo/Idh/MocA family oxidoreductase [Brachybacterium halotolerans subsp. kimchii]
MTTAPLSVAVIGAGMAGRTHANAWRQAGTVFDLGLPPVRLATIADAHLPFAEDAAAHYRYEKAVGDWREVADDPSIDVVSIVVGNALHREIAEAMVAAGKHVLCEKPLAGTLEDAEAMAALEAAHPDLVLGTGFTFRRNPAVAQLARLVADGGLGTVNHLDARYWCDYGADPLVPIAWRYKGPMGTGALGDIGSHLVDTAELIGGPIASVSGAVLTTSITERPVASGAVAGGRGVTASADDPTEPVENDDVATFTAHFASGAAGTFSCSRVAFGRPNQMMIDVSGSHGSASWDLARTGEIRVADGSSPAGLGGFRQVLANPVFPYFGNGSSMAFAGVGLNQIEQFTYQAHAFLQQVAGVDEGALPPCASFADGYREMRILDAVARSAGAGGASVEIA